MRLRLGQLVVQMRLLNNWQWQQRRVLARGSVSTCILLTEKFHPQTHSPPPSATLAVLMQPERTEFRAVAIRWVILISVDCDQKVPKPKLKLARGKVTLASHL